MTSRPSVRVRDVLCILRYLFMPRGRSSGQGRVEGDLIPSLEAAVASSLAIKSVVPIRISTSQASPTKTRDSRRPLKTFGMRWTSPFMARMNSGRMETVTCGRPCPAPLVTGDDAEGGFNDRLALSNSLHPAFDQVCPPDEVRHESPIRVKVDLPGCPDLHDAAILHHRYRVRQERPRSGRELHKRR